MRSVTFTLPEPFPLVNRTNGYSHFTASRQKRAMQRAVHAASIGLVPPQPFQRAHVLIERHGVQEPDRDNLYGGAKRLIDCLTTPKELQVRTPGARQRIKNKRGLGFIIDDAPGFAEIEVRHVKARLCDQRTVVTITEVVGEEVQ